VRHLCASDNTHKLCSGCATGSLIECVLIQDGGRRTRLHQHTGRLRHGLRLCASGLNGVERNLSAGEILEQLVRLRNLPGPQRAEPRKGQVHPEGA